MIRPGNSLLLLTAVLAVADSQAGDWARWRGPSLNGVSTETGWQADWPASGPRIAWKAQVGTGFGSFAVAEGRVFVMGNADDRDQVFCFEAASGKELWNHSYAEPLAPKLYEGGPNTTPTVDGDRVYTLSRQGKVFCLQVADGKVVWSKDLAADFDIPVPEKDHWGLSGSPFIEGDLVILNAGRAGIALKKASGDKVWSTGKEAAGYATPVPFELGGKRSLLMFTGSALVALDPQSGEERWQFPWKTSWNVNAADPIVSGNRIFLSSGYNTGGAVIEVTDGRPVELWRNKNMRNQMSGSILWEGHLYGVDENQLRCLSFDTGEVKWSERSVGKGTVTIADGKLIVLSDKGELMTAPASPEGFNPIARAQVLGGKCWTVPVLSNGRIYARNAKGDVVCLDVGGT
jgi:outer membrane protein assembly factor BamB